MAPGMAIAQGPYLGLAGKDGKMKGFGLEEALKKRNRELELQLKLSLEKEEKMRSELEKTKERLRYIEEAEERLCFEFGVLEAEADSQARSYNMQVRSLTEQLSKAQALLQAALNGRS